MNSYFLKLEFKNAGMFRKISRHGYNHSSKDFTFDTDGNKIRRNELPSFKEPITPYQISNMLHVLFGERPVPTLRKSYYGRNEYYWDKALNSYLKITTLNTSNFNFNEYPKEKIRTKKSVKDSWTKVITLTWELIKHYINDDEIFDKYVIFLSEILNKNVLEIPYENLINIVRSQSLDNAKLVFNFIKNLKSRDGLCNAFGFNYKNNVFEISTVDKSKCINRYLSKNSKLFLDSIRVVNSGIDDIVKLSGIILVPINNNDIQRLKNISSGTANILDDGFVWIDGIVNKNDLTERDFTDFIPVKNINTKKIKSYNDRNN